MTADEASDQPAERCWSCGADLPGGAIFCGECGSAVGGRPARPEEPDETGHDPAENAEAQPVADPNDSGLPPHGDALLEIPAVESDSPPERVSEEDAPLPSAGQNESGLPPHGDALLDPDAASAWSGEGPAEEQAPDDPAGDDGGDSPADGDNAPTAVQSVLDDPDGGARSGFASEAREPDKDDSADPLAPLTPEERFAAERLLDPDSGADKFVLQFSTGESATVYGSGLIGRNPIAEPGEYVDHFVVIRDPGRSVSKTHLEFGQDAGGFWVLDRFSGNGSVLREPEGPPRRCEPGRRYFVPRGTRIEIGDQFFVVS